MEFSFETSFKSDYKFKQQMTMQQIKMEPFTFNINSTSNKLESFKKKLININYFEDDNDINIIYPSTK
jgi:hypothetical protein